MSTSIYSHSGVDGIDGNWQFQVISSPKRDHGTSHIPSGELTKSYGKWPCIVDFPMKNGDFPLLC